MGTIAFVLVIAAAVVFALASVPVSSRLNLVSLGLLLLTLAFFVQRWVH